MVEVEFEMKCETKERHRDDVNLWTEKERNRSGEKRIFGWKRKEELEISELVRGEEENSWSVAMEDDE